MRRKIKKKRRGKYPAAFPSLGTDCYFPKSDIPRPVFRDFRKYPRYFRIKMKQPFRVKRLKKHHPF
jgi:hypothetical protein